MSFRGCWSCGAHGPCIEAICECAKCLDPDNYEAWRAAHPDEHAAWWDRQELDEDEECDCPSCR